MYEYFRKDELDVRFYEQHIAGRLPDRIIDAHVHINLPEHVTRISQEAIDGDWAAQCGYILPYPDAVRFQHVLFPDREPRFLALPFPLLEGDMPANNDYLAGLVRENGISSLMSVRPEWEPEFVEKILLEGGFAGFKPYPYFASSVKGAEVSIFDYLPRSQLVLANKHKKAVMLHLPRRERLADDLNCREICEIADEFPDLKLVLAHFGRSFNPYYFIEGARKLGTTLKHLYFDTAAVLNPQVYQAAFERLETRQIIFGTDMPIMMWHGKREWTEREYFNLCREDFTWNKHKYLADEPFYTFFIYEQVKTILDMIDAFRGTVETAQEIFYHNAQTVYQI